MVAFNVILRNDAGILNSGLVKKVSGVCLLKKGIMDFNEIVRFIGVESILHKKPMECSGGEKSRAVFARAILMKPKLILCDEPTASLDEENKEQILKLLFDMNQKYNTTVITVTHDLEVAKQHDRIIKIIKED